MDASDKVNKSEVPTKEYLKNIFNNYMWSLCILTAILGIISGISGNESRFTVSDAFLSEWESLKWKLFSPMLIAYVVYALFYVRKAVDKKKYIGEFSLLLIAGVAGSIGASVVMSKVVAYRANNYFGHDFSSVFQVVDKQKIDAGKYYVDNLYLVGQNNDERMTVDVSPVDFERIKIGMKFHVTGLESWYGIKYTTMAEVE